MPYNSQAKKLSPISQERVTKALQMNEESSFIVEKLKMSPTRKSPEKSKVKQIVSIFNSKKFSSELKQQLESIARPVPMPRTYLSKSFHHQKAAKEKFSACFLPEEVFAKLSVKEKAQLYSKVVKEMSTTSRNCDLLREHEFNKEEDEPTTESRIVEGKQRTEIPKPVSRQLRCINLNGLSIATSNAKPSDTEEGAYAVSSLRENTPEEEVNKEKTQQYENNFESVKSLKGLGEKKLRKPSVWKKESLTTVCMGKSAHKLTNSDMETPLPPLSVACPYNKTVTQIQTDPLTSPSTLNISEDNIDFPAIPNQEEQALEKDLHNLSSQNSSSNLNCTRNSIPVATPIQAGTKPSGYQNSMFWVGCGKFSIALEINQNIGKDRLQNMYDMFTKKSCETKELHFGIEGVKFSVHGHLDMNTFSTNLPPSKGSSRYWFATGDLVIPFFGKYLKPVQIKRLFRFIKETMGEDGGLHFGIDEIAFSNVTKFWHQPAEDFAERMDSEINDQSGDANSLPGGNNEAWPQCFNEVDKLLGPLSSSACGSWFAGSLPMGNEDRSMTCESLATLSLDYDCSQYETDSLSHTFVGRGIQKPQSKVKWSKSRNNEKHPSKSPISKNCLDLYKDTPGYFEKLKKIVNDISHLSSDDDLKSFTVDELDCYMYFLNRYSEMRITDHKKYLETVIKPLGE